MADDIEKERMAKVWWIVTGQYDAVNDKKKAVKYNFSESFQASNKTDAVRQAKSFFEKMKTADPAGRYSNFTKINAKIED